MNYKDLEDVESGVNLEELHKSTFELHLTPAEFDGLACICYVLNCGWVCEDYHHIEGLYADIPSYMREYLPSDTLLDDELVKEIVTEQLPMR